MSLLTLFKAPEAEPTTGTFQIFDTWGQYSSYVDADGRWRVIAQLAEDGRIVMQKFDTVIPIKEVQVYFADQLKDQFYDGETKLQTVLDDNDELIVDTIRQIRSHPDLTWGQYQGYLAGKLWNESIVIRAFLLKLALGLAERYGIQFDEMTEKEIMHRVRDWVCSVELHILKRVCFGYLITM